MPNAVGNTTLSFKYAVHPITLAGDGDDTFDVLTDHQHCNQKPKPPSTDCLHYSVGHHRLWPRQIVETDDEVDDNNVDDNVGDDNVGNNNNIDDNVDDDIADGNDKVDGNKWSEDKMDDNDNLDNEADDKDQEPPRKHVRHNSTCHSAKPTQLHFYPGVWADILEHGKQYFHLWLVNNCPFTECEANLPDAQCALKQAIDEFKAKDTEVELGKWSKLSAVIF